MPWYIFTTPQGQRQLHANSPNEAIALYTQLMGAAPTDSFRNTVGDDPAPGIGYLTSGSRGGAAGEVGDAGRTSFGPDPDLQEEFARPAYLEGVKRAGYNPEGAFGGFIKDRFGDALANFWAGNQLQIGRGQTPSSDFQAYSQANMPARGEDMYSQARDSFGQLAGGSGMSAQSALALRNLTGGPEGTVKKGGGSAAQIRRYAEQLAANAARGQYGGWGSALLPSQVDSGRRLEEELYRTGAEAGAGGAATSNVGGVDYLALLKKLYALR